MKNSIFFFTLVFLFVISITCEAQNDAFDLLTDKSEKVTNVSGSVSVDNSSLVDNETAAKVIGENYPMVMSIPMYSRYENPSEAQRALFQKMVNAGFITATFTTSHYKIKITELGALYATSKPVKTAKNGMMVYMAVGLSTEFAISFTEFSDNPGQQMVTYDMTMTEPSDFGVVLGMTNATKSMSTAISATSAGWKLAPQERNNPVFQPAINSSFGKNALKVMEWRDNLFTGGFIGTWENGKNHYTFNSDGTYKYVRKKRKGDTVTEGTYTVVKNGWGIHLRLSADDRKSAYKTVVVKKNIKDPKQLSFSNTMVGFFKKTS